MQESHDKLAKLLAIKSLETPSSNYFDSVVPNFHRRLRNRPEKVSLFDRLIETLSLPSFVPQAAAAAVLLVGVVAFSLTSTDRGTGASSLNLASKETVTFVNDAAEQPADPDTASQVRELILTSSALADHSVPASSQYVLDAQPAVYESGLSF